MAQDFQDAFISYGRADSKSFAVLLCQRLTTAGCKVWFDQNDIPLGVDFQDQIDDGIEKSDNFLFLIAPHSVNSPYCRKEIELALYRNKRIIPLLHVEQISRATWQQRYPKGSDADWAAYQDQGLHSSFSNMHPAIAKINWVYFREGIDDFETALTGLLEIFDRHRQYVNLHTTLLASALEWEKQQKQSRYLLVGEARQQAETWLKKQFRDEQAPCIPTDLHCEFITESAKNANNLMTQVFLSYAESDLTRMEAIRKILRRHHWTVWTNRTDIQTGAEFQTAISRGIEEADNVLYLLSPAALQSPYCQQEIDYALTLNKRIVPVLIQETDLSQVTLALRRLQHIDWQISENQLNSSQAESQLLRILYDNASYYEEHKVLLVKALKWQRQKHNPSLLLRGYNLRHAESWLKLANRQEQHMPTALQVEFITESLRQPPIASLNVFISYSRTDSDFARKLNDALQIQGKTTWFDQESIASGTDFQKEIYRGIETSNHFLFIISPNSIDSPYCANEVEYAQKLNKRVITVLHRPVNPKVLHPVLASVQWIDFNRRAGDFSANFKELLQILETDQEHLQSHTRLLVRAIEWDRNHRDDSYVLQGNDLDAAAAWILHSTDKVPKPTELQGDYITAGQKAQTSRQRARIRLQRTALAFVSLGLVAAIVSTVLALQQRKAAIAAQKIAEQEKVNAELVAQSLFAESLLTSGLDIPALLEGLKIGKQLQTQNQSLTTATRTRAIMALRNTVYGTQIRNSLEGYPHGFFSVDTHPNQPIIVGADDAGILRLWNMQGKLLRQFQGHRASIWSVKFSPDGKMFASGDSLDGTVKLWSLEGKLLKSWRKQAGGIFSLSFSPDGQRLATAGADQKIRIWQINGRLLYTLPGHRKQVLAVVFSPDGKTLASASMDETIRLWSAQGTFLNSFPGTSAAVTSLTFSPDSKILASASEDNAIRLWNPQGKLLKTLSGHTKRVFTVKFSPTGKTLASGSEDLTIKLWNLAGQELKTLDGHSDTITEVAFSQDGKTLVSASGDRSIKLWKIDGSAFETLRGHQDAILSVTFSPDSQILATASADQSVKLWNLQGHLLKTLSGHQGAVSSVTFNPMDNLIATSGEDQIIRLWNRQGKLIRQLPGHQDWVNSVRFNPDGQLLASASSDKKIRLWTKDGKLLKILTGHTGTVETVSFRFDSQVLASGGGDNLIKLWNLDRTLSPDQLGREIITLKGHQAGISSVRFSPDGKRLASTSADSTFALWNVDRTTHSQSFGQLISQTKAHSGFVNNLSFSPDGNLLVTAGDDKIIKFWNLEGDEIATLRGHTGWIKSLSFSPNGQMLASAGEDRIGILWDLNITHLMTQGCNQIRNYLTFNSQVKQSDRHLCDGVSPSQY